MIVQRPGRQGVRLHGGKDPQGGEGPGVVMPIWRGSQAAAASVSCRRRQFWPLLYRSAHHRSESVYSRVSVYLPTRYWQRHHRRRPTTNQKIERCSNSTTDSDPACSLRINPPHAERWICPRALAAASGFPPTASLDKRLDRRRTPHRSSSRRTDCTYCNAGRTQLRYIHCCRIPECGSRRLCYPIRGAG